MDSRNRDDIWEGELKLLELGIARTRERLAEFEKQFSMSSEQFQHRYDGQDLKESLDFIEWAGEIEMLRRLESKYSTLEAI